MTQWSGGRVLAFGDCTITRLQLSFNTLFIRLTLPRLQTTLFERTRLGKTGFQIGGSDLIQFIREDRLRHASGALHISRISYLMFII